MSTHQDPNPESTTGTELQNMPGLLAHALALEEEAAERYAELAEVMASHNNEDTAALFAKMAGLEQLHVEEIRQQIARRELKNLPATPYRWIGMEGPETTDHADLHYLMTPRQALSLALLNERRARDYYLDIAGKARDAEVAELARTLADEEREHVQWVKSWLERLPQSDEDWDHDDDLPNLQA